MWCLPFCLRWFSSLLWKHFPTKKDNDALDESTISAKSAAIDDEIYEKSFSLLSFSYLSADKVNDVESDIHDLFHLSKTNYKELNRWIQKYNELKQVR